MAIHVLVCTAIVLVAHRLLFEMPPTGGVVATADFQTAKLLRYVTTMDRAIQVFEVFLGIFVLYYIVEEFLEVRLNCMIAYRKPFWRWNV